MKKEGGEGLKEIWKLGHSALFKLAAIWTWHLNCQDYIPAMRREFGAKKHQGCCSSTLWDAAESSQFWELLHSSVFFFLILHDYITLYNGNTLNVSEVP